MDALWGLVFTALATFVGLVLLLTFDATRSWVGFGDMEPTGLPGYLRGLFGMGGAEPGAEATAAE
jgi:hypothetical protein